MGFLCTPQIMGLTRDGPKQKKNGGKQKHRASGKAMLAEAGKERYSASETLDRTRSVNNSYSGFDSGFACWDAMCGEADEYRVPTKARDGTMHERGLRKDAVIGYAIIFNPPSEMTVGWTQDDYKRFYDDSWACLCEIQPDLFRDDNIRMDAVHRDEGRLIDDGTFTEHLHRFGVPKGRDGKYCGNKIDARLLITINERYPAMMRAKGWKLDDLQTTDWQRMKMDDEYRREWNDKRRERGRSVNKYLRDKLTTEIMEVANLGAETLAIKQAYEAKDKEADDKIADADEYSRRTRKTADDDAKQITDDAKVEAGVQRDAALRERRDAENDRVRMLQSLHEREAKLAEAEKQIEDREQAIADKQAAADEALAEAAAAAKKAVTDAVASVKRQYMEPKVQELYDVQAEYKALVDDHKRAVEADVGLVEFCKGIKMKSGKTVYDYYNEKTARIHNTIDTDNDKAKGLDDRIQASQAFIDNPEHSVETTPEIKRLYDKAMADNRIIRRSVDDLPDDDISVPDDATEFDL